MAFGIVQQNDGGVISTRAVADDVSGRIVVTDPQAGSPPDVGVHNIISLTEAAYLALTPDPNTLYLING